MRIILLQSNKPLELYIDLCILHALLIILWNLLAPVDAHRNTAGEILQEIWKYAKLKAVVYWPVIYYKKAPIEITSGTFYISFKASLKKLMWSLFLVALQIGHKDTQAKTQNANKRISDYFPLRCFLGAFFVFIRL